MALNSTRNFNLIKERIEAEEEVKKEKDWYLLTNVTVICLCIIISTVIFFFTGISSNNLDRKKKDLEQNITALESNKRYEIEASSVEVQDKYTVYKNFISNNVDFRKFYDEITQIYQGLQIEEFQLNPSTSQLEVEADLQNGGYDNLGRIIESFEANDFFEEIKINNVSYSSSVEQDTGNFFVDEDGTLVTEENSIFDPNVPALSNNLNSSDDFATSFELSITFDSSKVLSINN